MNDPTDLAYTAGYLDGDGCFYVGKTKKSPFYCHSLSVSSTDLDVLHWFKSNFNGSISLMNRTSSRSAQLFNFTFSRETLDCLEKIEPFLIEKQRESKILRSFRNPSFKENRDILVEAMKREKYVTGVFVTSLKEELESLERKITPTREDFAYLSGYIDAECSLGIEKKTKGKSPHYSIFIQCGNTKFPTFYWIAQRFPGKFTFIDNSKKHPTWRNHMVWRVYSRELLPILEGVLPFIKVKKQLCLHLFDFRRLPLCYSGNLPMIQYAKYESLKSTLERREEIYQKVRHLNQTII